MKAYYHPDQALHHPQTYFSRGKMRAPQEVPARAAALAGCTARSVARDPRSATFAVEWTARTRARTGPA